MNENEGRRDEDKEWVRQVDHQLVTAITAIQVMQDQVKELKDQARDQEITLHGERKHTGLVSEYERHDGLLTHLNSVIFMDSTGKKGLVHEVEALKRGDSRMEYHWKFLTAVAVALLYIITHVVMNWDKIALNFRDATYTPSEELKKEIASDKKKHRKKVANPLAKDILKAMKSNQKTE